MYVTCSRCSQNYIVLCSDTIHPPYEKQNVVYFLLTVGLAKILNCIATTDHVTVGSLDQYIG